MKLLKLLALAPLFSMSASAQPRYNLAQMQREHLNRAVVAVRIPGNKIFVSWRTLASDRSNEPFTVYRNGVKLTSAPLTQGGTCFVDEHPRHGNNTYIVRGGGVDGTFTVKADAPERYLPVKLNKPADGVTPDGQTYTYSANDATIADVDGDGTYEIILKWDPSNSKDNSFTGFSGRVFIDCYTLSGKQLWRIDMGKNIRAGAHYTQMAAYDFDGDGKGELMLRTADGTIDGTGRVIGNPDADFVRRTPGRLYGRVLGEHEYITVFEGATGKALASADYIPQRVDPKLWGDDNANRSDRFLCGVAFLDGRRASAIFARGYYTRTVVAAWDWDGHSLSTKWVFDTNTPEWNAYAGQGNHNLRVADVDGDGCDEITYGAMAIDHDGRGLYTTGMGHGDALHLTAFYPDSDRLQVWDVHEDKRDGSDFRDAATGKIIFKIPSNIDVGRGMAADIDPTNPGVEMWSSDSHGIRNVKGEQVLPKGNDDSEDPQLENHWNDFRRARPDIPVGDSRSSNGRRRGGRGLSTNFGIWWDGDLLRELLDHEMVLKYDWKTGKSHMLQHFDGTVFNNWTKSNPCLSADFLGDWRKEVVARTTDSNELRIYISTWPTDYRINCLLEDVPYRLSVASENAGYNQPPETGFYLGPDAPLHPFLK